MCLSDNASAYAAARRNLIRLRSYLHARSCEARTLDQKCPATFSTQTMVSGEFATSVESTFFR